MPCPAQLQEILEMLEGIAGQGREAAIGFPGDSMMTRFITNRPNLILRLAAGQRPANPDAVGLQDSKGEGDVNGPTIPDDCLCPDTFRFNATSRAAPTEITLIHCLLTVRTGSQFLARAVPCFCGHPSNLRMPAEIGDCTGLL